MCIRDRSNSVSSFVLTSRLRVVNNSTDENDGDLFPIDLYSADRITFILQPPKGIDEIRLSSSAPGKAIELIVRASLVEGPNADRCQSSNADANASANANADADGDGAFDQLLIGAFFQASVAGRDADVLSEALRGSDRTCPSRSMAAGWKVVCSSNRRSTRG